MHGCARMFVQSCDAAHSWIGVRVRGILLRSWMRIADADIHLQVQPRPTETRRSSRQKGEGGCATRAWMGFAHSGSTKADANEEVDAAAGARVVLLPGSLEGARVVGLVSEYISSASQKSQPTHLLSQIGLSDEGGMRARRGGG